MTITEIFDFREAIALLSGSSLPTADLESNNTLRLFGAYQDGIFLGCMGLEMYGDAALFRSLAVAPRFRSTGVGRQLSTYAETFCRQNGVHEIFLLTESAELYFAHLGYTAALRESAPLPIRGTTQFSALCPSSSVCMKKILH